VLIGVGGVLMGWQALDAIAAVAVSMMIIHVGWQQLKGAFIELVDTGLPADRVEQITRVIESIDGVSHPHRLRTRRMGEHALIDVHVEVSPRISVSEGHQLAELVQAKLKAVLDEVSDVIVHIDPEGQERVWLDLPDRNEVCQQLGSIWSREFGHGATLDTSLVTLHYLDGQIDVELIWKVGIDPDPNQVCMAREKVLQVARVAEATLDHIRTIRVSFVSGEEADGGSGAAKALS